MTLDPLAIKMNLGAGKQAAAAAAAAAASTTTTKTTGLAG
eukprot:COSAG05_NODE_187_length_14703_cov_123.022186_6_plen_40_part_00